MPPKAIAITGIPDIDELPECTPNLMPFHIDHTGQAPISMYMRVDAAKEEVGAPEVVPPVEKIGVEDLDGEKETARRDGGVAMEVDASPVESVPVPQNATTEPSSSTQQSLSSSNHSSSSRVTKITDATKRFISTFRGRTIQGLKVDLPEGYTGLVLRGESNHTVTKKAKKPPAEEKVKKTPAKAKGRTTRASKKVAKAEEAEEEVGESMPVDETYVPGELSDDTPIRELVPSSKFSSFVLWHADIPVDEGRDEYHRTLTEWTRLAQEIHRVDD